MQWSSLCEDELIYNFSKFQHDQKLFKDINSGHHLFSNALWIQMDDSVFVSKNIAFASIWCSSKTGQCHWTHPTLKKNIEKTQHKKFSSSTTKRGERIFPLLSLPHSCQADEGSQLTLIGWKHRDITEMGIVCQLGGGAFVLGRTGKELAQHTKNINRKSLHTQTHP